MANSEQDKDFLIFVVKSIVNNPEDVSVERTIDEMGVLLTLRVHRDDMGQVVGRQGATAKAIRSLLRIVGLKNGAHVNLKILEPEGGLRSTEPKPAVSTDAPSAGSSDIDKVVEDLKVDL